MTITGQSSLSKDDIDQMVRDAEAHAQDDAQRKEEAEARNQADSLVYQTEKLIKDQGDKISASDKSEVENAIADLKTALAGDDLEEIKTKTETLMTSSQSFAQQLYDQAAATQNPGGAPDGDAVDDDDVVDAEIVEDAGDSQ